MSHPKRKKGLAVLVAALIGGLLALPVFLATPASAQARSTAPACANAPEKTWPDEATQGTAGGETEQAIDCIVAYGITTGKADGSYGAGDLVTREQMASFMVRKLQKVNGLTLPAPGNKFRNEPISAVHRNNVEIIAATNPPITTGYPDGTFKASRPVSREEMATFIVRQLRVAGATLQPADPGKPFPDVDENSPHREAISILKKMGIVQGNAAGNYDPKGNVTRGSMAVFLSRDLAELVAQNKVTPIGPGSAVTATSRPELQSARVVETNSSGPNIGTTVRYQFDENVTGSGGPGPVAANFHVYTFAGAAEAGGPPPPGADAVAVDPADNKAVLARFASITTAAGAAALSLATVDEAAVVGDQGSVATDSNPRGDAAIGTSGTTTFTPGITAAPDVATVGNFRADPLNAATNTLADFTFDEAAFNNTPTGYHLILLGGEEPASDITCTLQSGNGTTTHTVNCNPNPATGTITAAQVARGYVLEGAVDDLSGAGGNANALQAAEVSSAGDAQTPSLVSATLDLAAKAVADGTTDVDVITYTFSEAVSINAACAGPGIGVNCPGGAFGAYTTAGMPTIAGTRADRSSANPAVVRVEFANNALSSAVGANVQQGAVTEETGGAARVNQEDEIGVSNTTAPTTTPGKTANPDLIKVQVVRLTDPFGTTTGFVGQYFFDEDLDGSSNAPADFDLWLADGTELDCNTLAAGAGITEGVATGDDTKDDFVTCTGYTVVGGGAATNTQVSSAVIGTVDDTAVDPEDDAPAATDLNPEGNEPVTKVNF